MNPAATIDYTFERYLAAKKSVDDRALNAHVWQALAQQLEDAGEDAVPLRILEIGAGIGTMVERMLERGIFTHAEYDAIDAEPANIAAARTRLREWASTHAGVAVPAGDQLRIWTDLGERRTDLTLEACDAFDYLQRPASAGRYDLLVAHAFLDLVDVAHVLPLLHAALKPGGLLYATINFDGVTSFEPSVDPALDVQIERLYHATMDERMTDGRPSGDSRTGRHLIPHLNQAGFDVLAAGASDWVVHGRNGRYPDDEAYFLHFIVNTVDGALAGHAELDDEDFGAWVEARHAQIERGELVYIAHQLDMLAQI